MQQKLQVGSLFGIPLTIDRSWFFALILITLNDFKNIWDQQLVASPWIAGAVGFVMALLLFGSVLCHELGHSFIAQFQGIEVKSITLFIFGGVASIDRESKTPMGAFAVAIAGPLVSLFLYLICSGLARLSAPDGVGHFILADLAFLNLALTIFNLIPGLPLDGGQMLKALVWKVTGDPFKGIRYAAASGKILGSIGIGLGLLLVLLSGSFSGLWLAFIGWFILRNAKAYERSADLQALLKRITAAQVMGRSFRVLDAHLTLQGFAEDFLLAMTNDNGEMTPLYASSEGRYRGLVNLKALQQIERSRWQELELGAIATPLAQIPSVTEQTSLVDIICELESIETPFITVLSPAGAVAGVIDRGHVIQAIAKQYNLTLPAEILRRIRDERRYPSEFAVVAAAKQLQAMER